MLRRPPARRRVQPVAIAVLGAVMLTGCSGGEEEARPTGAPPTSRVLQGGAPGESNSVLTQVPTPPDAVTEEDVDFVRAMLLHHEQALQMTQLVADRSGREDVPVFAERIELSQADEMRLMQDWLKQRGEPVLDLDRNAVGHAHGEGQMPGMLTAEQLAELEAADGETFDRLFLQYMYRHHQGAVAMVEELQAGDGGQDPFIAQLTSDIDGDQRIEMDRMVGMLADLGAEPLPADG